ncbi:hypothetical protein M426DRAFT_27088 [Hypoxylon sp. CI-4A]|nr:hypothetical protein M426DRAFT_27088 [Hypoxylon sp. CI-4A]
MAASPHPRSSLKRTACDRCRHSKLRCYRDENQQKCARCIRLELRCEVAPAKPPGRPRKAVSMASSKAAPAGDSSDNIVVADTPSPQFLDLRSQSPPDARSSNSVSPPSQSPDLSPPEFSIQLQTHNSHAHTLFSQLNPPHTEVGGYDLSMIPPPASSSYNRIPEWYETSCFDNTVAAAPTPRDPLEVHSLFTAKLDRHECFKELSQLSVDLHVQSRVIQNLVDGDVICFATFCDHPSPPAGDGVSLAEKLLVMSQRFQQAVTNLGWVVRSEPRSIHASPPPVVIEDDLILDPLLGVEGTAVPSHATTLAHSLRNRNGGGGGSDYTTPESEVEPDNLLETHFACLLVSIYVQIIHLWEIMFAHVQRRTAGIDRSPLSLSDPSKGIQMGAFYIFSGRLVGMFFCQAVLYFLGNIDRGLGILPEQRDHGLMGLLSHSRHFDLLQKELGGLVSKGESERVRALRDVVEMSSLILLHIIKDNWVYTKPPTGQGGMTSPFAIIAGYCRRDNSQVA